MRSIRLLLLFALGFLSPSVLGVASGEESRSEDDRRDVSRLTVELIDGSRLIGTLTQTSLKIASESFGEVEVPISVVSTIELSSHGASMTLITSNGEKLRGAPMASALKIETLLGKFSIPLKQVTRVATKPHLLAYAVAPTSDIGEGYYLVNLVENGVSVEKGALLNILIKDNLAKCVNSSVPEYIGMSARIKPTGNNTYTVRFPHGTQNWIFSSDEIAAVKEVPDREERQLAIRVADHSLKDVERLNELLRQER